MIRGRDEACPACQKRTGDHTLDELDVCLGASALDLRYEEVDGGEPVSLRWTLGDRNVVIADHVVARALVAGEGVGPDTRLPLAVPVLHLEFLVGKPGAVPTPVGEIGLVGSPDGLRKMGKLFRDTANGAANAAERAAKR